LKFWKHLLFAFLTILGILYASFMLLGVYTQHNKSIDVPDFKGIYIKDLDNFIQDYTLEYIIVDSVYNSEKEKGTVIEQDPEPGASVKLGRKVYLTVNSMVNVKVAMPNLKDLSLRQAESLLETYGLKLGRLTYVQGLPPVMEQSFQGKLIAPGTMIEKGALIDLTLGRGDATGALFVPDLIGKTMEEALFLIGETELVLNVAKYDQTVKDTTQARIYQQSPKSGQAGGVYPGAKVHIWLTQSDELLLNIKNERE